MRARLESCVENGLWRKQTVINDRTHNLIEIEGKSYLNFASNDYLGLTTHPKVVEAFIEGAKRFGFGSGASNAVTGYYAAQQALEERFAAFLNREQAILFNSGYHANLGVLSVSAGRHHTVIADKLCHASLIDGITLSRSHHKRYHHHDIKHLEFLLSTSKNPVIVTESIFSMEGDISPIDVLTALAKQYSASLIVDDCHALGVLGTRGAGCVDYFNLSANNIDYLINPLGKACGGMGCIVSGSEEMVEGLRQFARTYRSTTALPPAVCHALQMALQVLTTESWRRERLQQNIRYFIHQAKQRSLHLISEDITPIKSILMGSNFLALKIHEKLLHHHFYVGCIRPPSVPKNTARLRISLNCDHDENQITQLLDLIVEMYEKFKKE
jgi:8-amino-7-oxononanoate synthase